MLDPRRWPWWGWAVAVAVLLLCVAATALLSHRQHGLGELRTLVRDLQADGRGVVPADLIARAPAVDRARQARLWGLVGNSGGGWAGNLNVRTFGLDARCAMPKEIARRDAEVERILTASASDRQAWRKLYQEGPVVISAFGWLAEDIPDPADAGIAKTAAVRLSNLLAMRALATALATEAFRAGDPLPALADLDALVAAQQPVGSLIDAMILLAVCSIRDQAWLDAVSRGAEPGPWIAQRSEFLPAVGEAFAAERMLFQGGMYQDIIAGRSLSGLLMGSSGTTWKEAFGNWMSAQVAYVTLPSDTAFALRCSIQSEDLCRTGIDATGASMALLRDPWFRITHPTAAIIIPNFTESAITAVQAETSARRLRIASALIHVWRATGDLPADDAIADFPARDLLAPQRHGPAILYQRLTPTRFRLWTDPATPPTDLLPAGRIDAPKPTSLPWCNRGWCTELDLSALPRTGAP